jgi:CheY-like chemotaxis protein
MRVLVVDDHIDVVMMLASTLRNKGYAVQSAYTASTASRSLGSGGRLSCCSPSACRGWTVRTSPGDDALQ